jgi:hypothetical protein
MVMKENKSVIKEYAAATSENAISILETITAIIKFGTAASEIKSGNKENAAAIP